MLIAGVLSLAIAAAARREPWGLAVTLVLVSAVVLFALFAGLYAAAFVSHQVLSAVRPPRRGESPFMGEHGPRYVEPRDPV